MLLCDDVSAFRDLMRMLLAEAGDIEIVGEASDGRTGIEAAVRLQPEVVLMDLSMPDVDGLEAIPALRAQVPGAAVVALSGFGAERMSETVRAAGASAYVEKGADVEAIRDAVLHAARTHVRAA